MLVGFGLEGRGPSDAGESDILAQAGCTRVFLTARNGAFPSGVVEYLRPGDTLVVTELRRLGGSVKDLILSIERLQQAGAFLKVLADPLIPNADMLAHLGEACSVLAAFYRTVEQKATGKARKLTKGRPAVLTPEEQGRARKLLERSSVRQVAAILGVSIPTLYRYFPRRRAHRNRQRTAVGTGPFGHQNDKE